jgi:hypothetical protein
MIIAAAKGEAQQITKGRGARASFMPPPLSLHLMGSILLQTEKLQLKSSMKM